MRMMTLVVACGVLGLLVGCDSGDRTTNGGGTTTAPPPAEATVPDTGSAATPALPATTPPTPPLPTPLPTPALEPPATRPSGTAGADASAGAVAATQQAGQQAAQQTSAIQSQVDQVMQYVKENKLDLAEKGLNQLDSQKASWSPSVQQTMNPKIEMARKALATAKGAGNLQNLKVPSLGGGTAQ